MFNFDNLKFNYDPYPIGVASNVLRHELYDQLAANFPAQELFEYKEFLGHKYSLSEVNNPENYHKFVRANALWRAFYDFIKREEFPYEVLEVLGRHNLDLGLTRPPTSAFARTLLLLSNLRAKPGAALTFAPRLRTRFEFSMLPAAGGCIKPHTDQPQKIVTLVVSMSREEGWDQAYGGGTEVMRTKDVSHNYNFMNRQLEFHEVQTLDTFEYQPNQCVIFIKTFNSLHGVRPMSGGDGLMRKTLTINIEQFRR